MTTTPTTPATPRQFDVKARERSDVIAFTLSIPRLDEHGLLVQRTDPETGEPLTAGDGTPLHEREESPALACLRPTGFALMEFEAITLNVRDSVARGAAARDALTAAEVRAIMQMMRQFVAVNLLPESRAWLEGRLRDPRAGVDLFDLLRPFAVIASGAAGGPTAP